MMERDISNSSVDRLVLFGIYQHSNFEQGNYARISSEQSKLAGLQLHSLNSGR